jgi:hypothetical protein
MTSATAMGGPVGMSLADDERRRHRCGEDDNEALLPRQQQLRERRIVRGARQATPVPPADDARQKANEAADQHREGRTSSPQLANHANTTGVVVGAFAGSAPPAVRKRGDRSVRNARESASPGAAFLQP